MKFNKLSQLFLVSIIGLTVAALLTSCNIATINYVFLACSSQSGSSAAGEIQTYDMDAQSGALRSGAATVSSGGINPVQMAVSSDYANIYVVNAGSDKIVHFSVGSNGVLTLQSDSISTTDTPVAVAVNAAGTFLYVISGTSSATLTEYHLSSGVIGSAVTPSQTLKLHGTYASFAGDTLIPTAITVLANNAEVYVAACDVTAYSLCTSTASTASSTANSGWVFGFAVNTTTGVLYPDVNPYEAGVKPSAIASDPTSRFVYVTDFAMNHLIGYGVTDTTTSPTAALSTLTFLINGPFKTGNEPMSIAIDPRGKYIYVANSLDNSVSSYTIDVSNGTPSTNTGTGAAGSEPVAVIVDPAEGDYVYTADFLGDTISGMQINADTGAINGATQASPYPVGYEPTAIVSVPHGNHAVQVVNQ